MICPYKRTTDTSGKEHYVDCKGISCSWFDSVDRKCVITMYSSMQRFDDGEVKNNAK